MAPKCSEISHRRKPTFDVWKSGSVEVWKCGSVDRREFAKRSLTRDQGFPIPNLPGSAAFNNILPKLDEMFWSLFF